MNNIRKLRKARGLNQTELARICNISQGSLSGYETGSYEPDITTLKRLADFFHVSVDDVVGYKYPSIPEQVNAQDDELWELREQLRRDPERQVLFSLAKDADITEVRQAVAILDALKKTNAGR